MKNIHILPTNKPSRLFIDIDNDKLTITNNPIGGEHFMNQNVYITSDEEINDGDWCFHSNQKSLIQIGNNEGKLMKGHIYLKKIILTTDQDLIKDGVQTINDEFLEWFVKNQSCEWVEAKDIRTIPALQLGSPNGHLMYQIIIPKEEPKQETTTDYIDKHIVQAMVELAKQKMYSEEEVFNLLMELSSVDKNSSSGTPHSIAKWFEQFKK